MDLHGLQKMTLLDFPGKVACTVFLAGCDLRCPFCHNYGLVDGSMQPLLKEEELYSFLETRRGILDGVAITGGEPLLRPDLAGMIRRIRAMGFLVKLDTNGFHPDGLHALLSEGLLDYVAMDIKNSPRKYPLTCGLSDLVIDPVRRSIAILLEGKTDYEFRTTVMKELHEAEDFEEIGKLIKGAGRYFLQPFILRDTVPDQSLSSPDAALLDAALSAVRPYVGEAAVRGDDI